MLVTTHSEHDDHDALFISEESEIIKIITDPKITPDDFQPSQEQENMSNDEMTKEKMIEIVPIDVLYSQNQENMSNDEITKDKVIEIVPGDEVSSQNQESMEDGITEDDAVDFPKEFQWKKYVFVAIMLIMVWLFFFKTENVSKQEKTDYGIKTSTTQYEVESKTQYEAESSTQIKEPAKKSNSGSKKEIKIKNYSEKETKADSEKEVKIKADLKDADIKTYSKKDKKLEIKEIKTEEKIQQKNELEEEKRKLADEKRKLEDEKREAEKIQKKKWWYRVGAFWFAIGSLLIIIWLSLGYWCCGSRPGYQNNIWSRVHAALVKYLHKLNNNPLSTHTYKISPNAESNYFLWYDTCDFGIFVSGLVFMILGLAVLLITYIALK